MKHAFQKQEAHTTDAYVSDLTRQLRRSLPREKAEQIAREAHAHLTDHVDDLTSAGLDRTQAEAQAVAGFGPVRTYAQTAIAEAYGDRTSARWRLIARLGAANFLAFNVVFTLYPSVSDQRFWVMGALAGGLMVPLFALASRRPQTRHLLALSLATVCAVGIGAGLRYIPNSETRPVEIARINSPTESLHGGPGIVRGDHRQQIASIKRETRLLHEETALLAQGATAYQSDAPLPASLKPGGRFVVPVPYNNGWDFFGDAVDLSAFKAVAVSPAALGAREKAIAEQPYQFVETRQEAVRLWAERGPAWLAGKQRRVAYHAREIATLEQAAHAPLGFNWGAATYHISFSLWLCAALVVLDFLLAHLGRLAWIHARNFRNRQMV